MLFEMSFIRNLCHGFVVVNGFFVSFFRVPSILMLHFVEGLPHNNLENYSFQFEGGTYQITSVVQYQTDKKHFITWSLNPDGKNHKFYYNASQVYINHYFKGYCLSLHSP